MRGLLSGCYREWFFVTIFSIVVNTLALAMPLYMMQVYDRVLSSRSAETLLLLTLLVLGLIAAMMALDGARQRILAAIGYALDETLSEPLIRTVVETSSRPGAQSPAASLRDLQLMQSYLSSPGIVAFFDLPWVPIFIALLFILHPYLGFVGLAGAVLLSGCAVLNERLARAPLARAAATSRASLGFVEQATRNADAVVGLGMVSNLTGRWTRLGEQVRETQRTAGARATGMLASTRFLRLSLQVAVVAVGAYTTIIGDTTPSVILAATLILGRGLAPLELSVAGWRGFVEARTAHRRLAEALPQLQAQPEATGLAEPCGALLAEQLVFAPGAPDKPSLKNVSFTLDAGQTLGLVGPSAAGKSTLARLLVGVWTPWSGSVRLDGAEVALLPESQRRNYIGYLPQGVELMPGTVADNITRFAASDPADVVTAAKRAHAHEMILHLDAGYDTEIGEQAALLSGGQRQRIALARALYGDPRVVVMDEPNANLDSEGEEALRETLKLLKREGVTVVIITHKPSLLMEADQLLVLRQGVVELYGPAAEVIRRVVPAGTPVVGLAAGDSVSG